ncbi:hypothetical protein [Streptomyces sp. NPDC046853]|uniref:hypothetical protein n=1 Tax=unclassified Streptomyces TaxID=2593676 RepID=UPI0033C04FFF
MSAAPPTGAATPEEETICHPAPAATCALLVSDPGLSSDRTAHRTLFLAGPLGL